MVTLACLLLVGVFAGLTIAANEEEPTLSWVDVNVSHEEEAHIVYNFTVSDFEGFDANNVSVKFYETEPTAETKPFEVLSIGDRLTYTGINDDGSSNFTVYSVGFAPKYMTKTIYAQACYEATVDGETKTYASPVKAYSVFEYICQSEFRADATADQKALYAAMEEYINYAQDYLGYDNSTSVDDLLYLQVNNGYFVMKPIGAEDFDYDTEYKSATFLNGTGIEIHASDDIVYPRFITEASYAFDDKASTLSPSFEKLSKRNITAVPGVKVTLDANMSDVVLYEYSADNSNGYIISPTKKDEISVDGSMIAVKDAASAHRTYILSAPLSTEEGAFSYWKDAEGSICSYSPAMKVDDVIAGCTQDELTLNYTPVYGEDVVNVSAQLGNAPEAYTSDAANLTPDADGYGYVLDSTGKTKSGNNTVNLTGTTEGGSAPNYLHFTTTIQIDPDTTETGRNNYFLPTVGGYQCFYQNKLMYGTSTIFMLTYDSQKVTSADTAPAYYYLAIKSNTGTGNDPATSAAEFTSCELQFGTENVVDIYVELTANGEKTQVKNIHVYANGTYLGCTNIEWNSVNVPTAGGFTYGSSITYSSTVQGQAAVKLTQNSVKLEEILE